MKPISGEFHGQRSLVGYSPWGHKELDMTEQLMLSLTFFVKYWQFKIYFNSHVHTIWLSGIISHLILNFIMFLCYAGILHKYYYNRLLEFLKPIYCAVWLTYRKLAYLAQTTWWVWNIYLWNHYNQCINVSLAFKSFLLPSLLLFL